MNSAQKSDLAPIFGDFWQSEKTLVMVLKIAILLIRDMVVERCNRRFGYETIHRTQKCISMNLLQMSCVITWA